MKLLIIGDVHGQLYTLTRILRQAQELYGIEGAIQVGDFGFYPQIIDQFRRELGRFRLPVWAIDGNHEDHGWLVGADLQDLANRRLHYMPRGSKVQIGGATVGFCGGALNVDRPQECDWNSMPARKHVTLPEDARWTSWLTITDAERAAARFNEAEPLDLLVTHSCPARIGVGQCGNPALIDGERQFIRAWGINPGPPDDVGEPALTHLWNKLVHKPATWVYGHFHGLHQRQLGDTSFTCVGSGDSTDGQAGQLPFIYDTVHRTLELAGTERLCAAKYS